MSSALFQHEMRTRLLSPAGPYFLEVGEASGLGGGGELRSTISSLSCLPLTLEVTDSRSWDTRLFTRSQDTGLHTKPPSPNKCPVMGACVPPHPCRTQLWKSGRPGAQAVPSSPSLVASHLMEALGPSGMATQALRAWKMERMPASRGAESSRVPDGVPETQSALQFSDEGYKLASETHAQRGRLRWAREAGRAPQRLLRARAWGPGSWWEARAGRACPSSGLVGEADDGDRSGNSLLT